MSFPGLKFCFQRVDLYRYYASGWPAAAYNMLPHGVDAMVPGAGGYFINGVLYDDDNGAAASIAAAGQERWKQGCLYLPLTLHHYTHHDHS